MQRNEELRPPLVRELFDVRFSEIRERYPLAQAAGADIRRAMERAQGTGRSVAIEDFIRTTYRDADSSYDRRKYYAVPWYLQDLLYEVGRSYTRDPDNVNLLLSEALRFPEVIFITLNYDTILDERLVAYDPLWSLGSYIDRKRNWKLIKLHGSVNWGRKVKSRSFSERWIESPPDATKYIGRKIELRSSRSLTHLRRDAIQANEGEERFFGYWYPALSVPVGAADELVCPEAHVEFLREALHEQRIHLLVLGYSAHDQEVLTLLAETNAVIVSGRIVVSGLEEAREVHGRLDAAALPGIRNTQPSEDDFEAFVQGDGLKDYVKQVKLSTWNPWD